MFLLAGLSIVHWNLDAATFNKLQPFRKKTQMLLCHTGSWCAVFYSCIRQAFPLILVRFHYGIFVLYLVMTCTLSFGH